MATNISKYLQIDDFLLLEYEFNRDGVETTLTNPYVIDTCLGSRYFYEGSGALGGTNNILALNSIPTNATRTEWLIDSDDPIGTYSPYWDSSTAINTSSYPMDTVKLHIVSGYNFDDVDGFLLQIRAINSSTNTYADLANFTYAKQDQIVTGNVIQFATNTLYLGNKFYDKYFEFQVPSVQNLGGATDTSLGQLLNVTALSDVYITYSTLYDIINNEFVLDEQTHAQLPVTSAADRFNCYIAESTAGDFIEYYATWDGNVIGDYINDIESGYIRLYTSNNPNDNYSEFSSTYGTGARKWVLIHEISVYEHIPGGTTLLTQKFAFTQDSNYSDANYFRPILRNSDIDSSYTIQYVCRLTNRMDGTQIIRKASFASTDPKKYGLWFTRITTENLIPYKVFNKVESEYTNVVSGSSATKTKYVKVFFDTAKVVMNAFNEVFPSGTGPLFLKSFDSVYKLKFERINTQGDRVNVDLSGAFNYALLFKLDDNTKIEVGPTYSTNMNTTIGELEFKLTENQLTTLKKQVKNNYSVIVKNPNGTSYVLYEGPFYDISDETKVIENYQSLYSVTDLQTKIGELEAEVNRLTDENTELRQT